ncbi:G-protein coupled receptor GRL101-like isoform X2 [Patiria miniata]|uniref:G-protein coupled receptor GRL101 n=1 Tax=Patiria miniata TaxID=46514 RepID=A0A914BQ67_PATMI|nr:G-protein coupled receptor GRL101-like isoform X2 [Patiria miniata]
MLDIGRGNGFLAEYEVVRYAPTSNFSVSSIPVDEDNWYQYNDFLYKFFEENAALNWLEAEGLCSERSSHLVSIHNQQEAEFLHTMQQIVWRVNRPATHIGLTAKSTTGIFRWSDGSPMVYTDWMQLPERQPDGDLVESCTMIDMTNYRTTALWHDIPCAQTRESTSQYICKKPSPDAAPRERIKQTASKDTVMECSNNFNLIQCGNQECTHKLFGCTNETERGGSSIPSTWQKVTALDPGQDACPSSFFQCGTGDCIPISFVCDFVPHCIDSTDEKRCDYRNCTDGEFRCDNGQCVEAWRHCDLTVDCIDGTDESNCDESASGFRCFDGRFIPLGAVCDRAYDCQGGLHEDEDGCPTWGDTCETNEIQCKSGLCVSEQHRCIYDIDKYGYVTGCPDVTHLGDCGSFACPEMYFHCPEAHCIPPRFRCDQKTDCPHGEDEIDCDDYTCPGAYRCHVASYCLHLSKVCDSVNDCPDGDDELFCGLPCPAGCECTGLEYACDIRGYQLDSSAEIPSIARSIKLEGQPIRDVEGILRRGRRTTLGMNAELDEWFPINMSRYHMLAKLEIISVGIDSLPRRIFDQTPNLIYIDLSDNNIATLQRGSFQGLDSLRHLRLLFNPLTLIEDGAFMGLANLEILNIYATEPEEFSNEILIDLSGLQTLYAGKYLFCCIAVDTLGECLAPRDQFSSCKDLMKNPVLRVSIWILGISAFLGNFLVVVFRSMALYKGRDGSPIQTFFIANLAVSDFLMGAYMIIIGSADLYYREVYALREEAWKASFTCKFGGFLSVVSSQASVLMVTLLSLDRCAHIVFPFKKALHLRPRSSRIAVGLLWVVAVLIAALPLLITPYFNDNFYGHSSVCLALPLTVELQPGYEYMFFILGVNFVCFLLILFTYLAIFVTVKRSSSKVKSSKAAADVKLAGKMALIIGTDFACWMPIIIMAVLASAGGVSIPPEIYAWTAVFILPLNSSINPYLYTISTYSSSKKTKGPATSNSTGVASVSSAVSPITKVQMDPEYLDQRNNSIIALPSLPLRPTSNNNNLPLQDHDKDQNTDNKTSGTSSDPATQPQEENFYVEMQDLVECERNKLTAGDISVIGADLKKALSWLHSRNVTGVDMREELIVLEKTGGRNKAYLLVPEAKLRNKGEKATDDEKDKDKRKLEVLLNKLTASTLA